MLAPLVLCSYLDITSFMKKPLSMIVRKKKNIYQVINIVEELRSADEATEILPLVSSLNIISKEKRHWLEPRAKRVNVREG